MTTITTLRPLITLLVSIGVATMVAVILPRLCQGEDLPVEFSRIAVGRWMHAHEEDQRCDQIFRPATFSFPPARGREGMELHADARALLLEIAPDDGEKATPVTWAVRGNELQLSNGMEVIRSYLIKSANAERIVLHRLNEDH